MYRGDYGLVGAELSMFSRKLEAQLRCQQVPWSWHFKTEERAADIEARTGTHFIPALLTPEKWMIHDTIALGPLLNDRFKSIPVIPATPTQRACCFILEDAFNHWLGRICVHTRWCYPENVAWVGPRFGANRLLNRSIEEPFTEQELKDLAPVGEFMYQSFGKNVCDYNGVGPEQAEAVSRDFNALLEALDAHFSHHPFLLGDRPCLADFALAGACKAHFVTDPIPLSWLGDYRDAVIEYTARLFGDEDYTETSWLSADAVPDSLDAVWRYLDTTYFAFARANIKASDAGEKYYEYDYGYGPTRARTQRRLNKARLHVQDELQQLDDDSYVELQEVFADLKILEFYGD